MSYQPRIKFEDGIRDLADWVRLQTAIDKIDMVTPELVSHSLTI
jgi:hypothetical protein